MLRDITLGQYYPADSIPSFCSTTGATCLEPYSLR